LVAGAARRSRCRLDSQALFPDVCAKNEKWFRGAADLFRGDTPDEIIAKIIAISNYYRRFQTITDAL
jgi:hypothetical protein